jgi:hypothetical protein
MLKWICAEYRPLLLKKKAGYETSMLEVAVTSLRENLAASGGTQKTLGVLRDPLQQLQDMYAEMTKRLLDEDARKAG